MRGYLTSIGYMGYIPTLGKYRLFATESDYVEWYERRYGNVQG